MVSVRKRDGSTQEFDRDKLEISLLNARVSAAHVVAVAEMVAASIIEGIATSQIRHQIVIELSQLDQQAAKRYEEFKTIPA